MTASQWDRGCGFGLSIGAVVAFAVFVLTHIITYNAMNTAWKREAVREGHAEYRLLVDPKTGEPATLWAWKRKPE